MAQNEKLEDEEVHYVYGDQEYVLEQDELNPELRDLICGDGSRAILVDGQYIVTDSQAILLQEGDANLTQYYINDNEGFVVDGDESSVSNLFEETECVQLVEEDTNDVQQIIYYTNDDPSEEFTPGQDTDVEGIEDEDGNIYPFKRIRLEGQMLNFDEFVQRQEGLTTEQEDQNSSVSFTIMEEETQTEPTTVDQTAPKPQSRPQTVDLSKITGRNLITGQTVTLDSYMEKLKRRLNRSSHAQLSRKSGKKIYQSGKRPELSGLLDRKISIGKTKSGKKIVGKIIHVERKGEEEQTEVKSPVEALPECREAPVEEEIKVEENTRILVRKSSVSMESFEQISLTLGGVMEMESVRKKLENKNIVVKVVEKKYSSETDSYVKNTSYCYGYMEKEGGGKETEKWKFVPDQDTQDVLLGEHFAGEEGEEVEKKSTKFPVTTSLTILFSSEKGGYKTIKVNLNPAPGNLCNICAQYFKTNLQLRHHMQLVHNTYGNSMGCEVCDLSFDDLHKLQEHRNIHVAEGKLFICSECSKCFTSQNKLQKHLPTHDLFLRPLQCEVCEVRCASEWALKKHLLTHTGIKPYACDICSKQFMTQYDVNFHKKIHFPEKHFACNICLRTFSRHSNLLRHTEIHKGTGALYKCDICYCSYNYISSLTRHMVQNHIDAGEFQKKGDKAG